MFVRDTSANAFSGEDGLWGTPMLGAAGKESWDLVTADIAILGTAQSSETYHDIAAKLPESGEHSIIVVGFPGFQSEEQWILEQFQGEGDPKQVYKFVMQDLFGGCEHKIASKVPSTILSVITFSFFRVS